MRLLLLKACQPDALYPCSQKALRRSVANVIPTYRLYTQNQAARSDRIQQLMSKSRLLSRLNRHPKFTAYVERISKTGTVTTVTSFFILHEITAVLPLFGLWWILYQFDLPESEELPDSLAELLENCSAAMERLVGDRRMANLDRHKVILSGTLSYATIKLLYPVRMLFSLWAAPYFGKWLIVPVFRLKKLITRK